MILSPMEQSIKRKIEAVGKPLKDWDIQINYGIKTGCNEAFIIDEAKRAEILSNCQSDDERERTEAIIRPILRGRDIRRYGYDWAGLYIIGTFPALKLDIESYPSLKQYFLDFGYDRLKQTGDKGARKKTSNQWFETQDSISYWEEFEKPKIVWKRIGSILRFCYNENGALGLDSTCFIAGVGTEFLCCLLNSPMGHFLLKDSPKTGTGDLLISIQAVEPIRVPPITEALRLRFERLLTDTIGTKEETFINNEIFSLYRLSREEQEYIKDNFSD